MAVHQNIKKHIAPHITVRILSFMRASCIMPHMKTAPGERDDTDETSKGKEK